MSPRLPDGEPAPADGALPATALAGLGTRPFGIYVHVPFCASRCGYCDFNTYVPGEGVRREGYVDAVLSEWALAQQVLGGAPPAATVFVGGGTPTLLPVEELSRLLDGLARAPGAEVTVEANPDSVDGAYLRALRAAGATRISLGMQSASAAVLATLDRSHTPGGAVAAAQLAREAGFAHVSLDLIHGAPGERDADWEATLAAVAEAGADHVSAYPLTIEPGTRLHARLRRGALAAPDAGLQARRYRRGDAALAALGLEWYEVCNWAAGAEARCRHNGGYWRSHDWWGLGPGAHSHVGGVRWWNVLHPARHAERVRAGRSPAAGRERLTAEQRALERVLLGIRLREGLALTPEQQEAAHGLVAAGLLDGPALARGQARLTLEGRIAADEVVLALSPSGRRARTASSA
jgi:putative oxygen-independent coproporphyrinogen III oxidase